MPLVLDGTNGVSGVDGTASNPAIEGTDSNTGIFYPAADTVAIGTGGTEALRVTSAQNVRKIYGTEIQSLTSGGSTSHMLSYQTWNGTANLLVLGNTFDGVVFGTGGGTMTEKMRLDASGNLGIGTTSPNNKLVVNGAIAAAGEAVAAISNGCLIDQTAGFLTRILNYSSTTGSAIAFYTGSAGTTTERARIDSSGNFMVATTNTDPPFNNVVGISLEATGTGKFSRDGNIGLDVNRKTNDGTLVRFFQDGTVEGTISVAGTTVSYNGGNLARWSQLLNSQRDESIVKGTVLSNLDEMCEWLDAEGNPLPNEQLNRTKVSDVEGDTNVAGVFVNWDNDDQDNPYDMNIAMTGDMIIRIAQGITVQKGDLLMSAGDGTAKPQGDDIVRSKTVAKVTSNHVTCTYDDGSYCVPCVLMAC